MPSFVSAIICAAQSLCNVFIVHNPCGFVDNSGQAPEVFSTFQHLSPGRPERCRYQEHIRVRARISKQISRFGLGSDIFLYIAIFFVYTKHENMYLNLFDVHIILYNIRM